MCLRPVVWLGRYVWRWFAVNGVAYRVCVRCNRLEAA